MVQKCGRKLFFTKKEESKDLFEIIDVTSLLDKVVIRDDDGKHTMVEPLDFLEGQDYDPGLTRMDGDSKDEAEGLGRGDHDTLVPGYQEHATQTVTVKELNSTCEILTG